MVFRNILIKLLFDFIEEITIRLRNRRIRKEKEAFEKAEKERLKKQTAQRIEEAKENIDKIDPSKYEVN